MPAQLLIAVVLILAICTAVMAKGLQRNPYLWGGIAAALGFFVFPLLAYLPMPVLYVLARRAGGTTSPLSAAVFRFTSFGLAGAVAGFVGGFLLPPSVQGDPIPFAFIFQDTIYGSMMRSYMMKAVGLGVLVGLGVTFGIGKLTRNGVQSTG